MKWPHLAAASVAVTTAAAAVLLPGYGDGLTSWGQVVLAVAYGFAGWLLASRRPQVMIGWLALAAAFGYGAGLAAQEWSLYASVHGLPGASWTALVSVVLGPLEVLVFTLTYALFPDGRYPRGWIGGLAGVSIALGACGWLYGIFAPFDPSLPDGIVNPLDVGVLPAMQPVGFFAAAMMLASIVIVVRWLRARGQERQVLRWLAVVNLCSILATPLIVALPAGELISSAGTIVVLIVVVAVVLRNQVYGLDVVLNRTLVYTLLTAFVAAVYGAGTAVLALAGQRVGGPWTIAAAVGAAFSLAPARERFQRLINRFLYGERDEPYALVARIGARLETAGRVEQVLPDLLEAIAGALKLPLAAVELHGSRRFGPPADGPVVRFPLVYQGDNIGALVIGLRSGQNALDLRETRLMADIARQVAVAARNVLLTEEVMRSRERIVHAAEEERRRLRHDLHDGLGPVLTAAATKVDAVANLLARDTGKATTVLAAVRKDLTAALEDLRRLVYALRPPVLDELGLFDALREYLRHTAVPVSLRAPEELPDLPAAVEIAAYRIVTEAVTNVTRHAGAATCSVEIGCDGRLTLEIRDDGRHRDSWAPGVGLTSMRERATVLGGTCTAGPTPSGGRVRVELPLNLAGAL
ncbi:sensor histidine kinase [Microbispora sp. NPDC046933]|uniref:sensor histidine kinase n=1 Tax=Microbispora sp. NPDC046933 TaxID=3155618 RepID=UPI0033E05F94